MNDLIGQKRAWLEEFFKSVGKLSFDSSKKLLDRESRVPGDNLWMSFLRAMNDFLIIERSYSSLQFAISVKRQQRPLKECLSGLSCDLLHLYAEEQRLQVSHGISASKTLPFGALCKNLSDYVKCRHSLVGFYEKLTTFSDYFSVVGLNEASALLTGIDTPEVVNLPDLFEYLSKPISLEIQLCSALIETLVHLENLDFLKSITALYEAHRAIGQWAELVEPGRAQGWFSSGPAQQGALFTWLAKLKNQILSKMALYYSQNFADFDVPSFLDSKGWTNKLAGSTELLSRLAAICKKFELDYVSLYCNAEHVPDGARRYSYSLLAPGRRVLSMFAMFEHQQLQNRNVLAELQFEWLDRPNSTVRLPDRCFFLADPAQSRHYHLLNVQTGVVLLVSGPFRRRGNNAKNPQLVAALIEVRQSLRTETVFAELRDRLKA